MLRALPPAARTSIFLLGALLLLSALYLGVVLNVPYEADAGSIMTMARAILEGNVLLKGWTLGTLSFWTTEFPSYVAAIRLFGFNWRAIYLVTAVHWAAIALLIIYLGATDRAGRLSFSKLLIAASLSFYLASLAYHVRYLSTGHLVTFSYCLICLLCIRKLESTGKWWYYLGFGVFLALSLIGDVFGLFIIAIPVSVVCLARIVVSGPRRSTIGLLAAIVAAVALSRVVLWVMASLGAAAWAGPPASFVSLEQLERSPMRVLSLTLQLFSADFLGKPVASMEAALGLLHFSGLLIFTVVLCRVATRLTGQTLTTQSIFAIVVCDVLAVLLSAGAGWPRFLVPALIFGSLLVVEVVHESALFRARRPLVLLYFLLLLVSLVPPLRYTKPSTQYDGLAQLLVRLDLKRGYAPYSKSCAVTVATAGEVTVAPVYLRDGTDLAPFFWLADPAWYQAEANFVIVHSDAADLGEPGREDATRAFGEPSDVYSLGASGDLLVWDHNIAPYLASP